MATVIISQIIIIENIDLDNFAGGSDIEQSEMIKNLIDNGKIVVDY